MAKVSNTKVKQSTSMIPTLSIMAFIAAIFLLMYYVYLAFTKRASDKDKKQDENKTKSQKKTDKSQDKNRKLKQVTKPHKFVFSHKHMACHLKMHSGLVTSFDWSFNEKLIASIDDDRSIGLWILPTNPGEQTKSIKVNVELDHGLKIRFLADDKAFFVNLYNNNDIRAFKLIKKDHGTSYSAIAALDFSTETKGEILDFGVSSNGKFLAISDNETTVKIFTLKGELLHTIDTKQIRNFKMAVSPCGRFVGSCGFAPDVKVWEVEFGKSGNFQTVSRAFELKGHSASVYNLAFSAGSERMVTISKDLTFKLWNTDVEYKKGQDAYLLQTCKLTDIDPTSQLALTPDGLCIAITRKNSVLIYEANCGELMETIENIFLGDIREISFSRDGLMVGVCGDKHITLFHNVNGIKAKINELTLLNKKASGAMEIRLKGQIKDLKEKLAVFN